MKAQVTRPTGSTTIFPRINFYKTFGPRGARRDANGRIFGTWFGVNPPEPPTDIDDPAKYPPLDGSTCLRVSYPHDLGPSVVTVITNTYDLRECCDACITIDLEV